ncbi:MAG TPA: PASTA domain-containing protein, partial [Candidatus Hydrogenedentes bacterium]|nr:PASTA domain-containing protein [Candidatus Hydrogenedentota bacterium]
QQLLKTDALSQVEMNNDADTVVPRPTPEDLDVDLASLITPLDTLDLLPGRALDPSSSRTVPNLIGMTKSQAQESLQRLGIIMDAQGVGWVSAQNPEPGTLVEEGTMCALQFGNKLSGADKDDTG